jgi:hypothetical protein
VTNALSSRRRAPAPSEPARTQTSRPALSTREGRAAYQREYRERTGREYDKKYKKAERRALARLKQKYPRAYKKIFDEEMERLNAEEG